MLPFLYETIFAVAGLSAFALVGGFVIPALRGPYVGLCAPLVGIGIFAICAAILWGQVYLPFWATAYLIVIGGLTATAFAIFRTGAPRVTWGALSLAGLLIFVTIALHSTGSLRTGSPAIGMGDGAEQANYAQITDWVLGHKSTDLQKPAADWASERFPREELAGSSRAGSYYFLGMSALIKSTSGLFAYDLACLIAWLAALIGIAGAVARTPLSFIVLVTGLSMTVWYDFGKSSFLGKLLAYPSALMAIGVALSGRPTQARTLTAVLLAFGASTLHSGMATALMIAAIGAPFLLHTAVIERRLPIQHGFTIAVMFLAAVATTGALVRFPAFGYPDWHLSWSYIIPRVLDIENQGITILSTEVGTALSVAALAIWLALIVLSLVARQPAAVGFLVGPLLLLAAMYAMDARAAAFQLMGFFYPALLCAGAILLNGLPSPLVSRASAVILAMLVVSIGLRAPRMWFAVDRYAWNAPADRTFSERDVAGVVRAANGLPVYVDTKNNQVAYVMRVELPRRGVAIFWSDAAWDSSAMHHFMNTPAPKLILPAVLVTPSNEVPAGTKTIWASPSVTVRKMPLAAPP